MNESKNYRMAVALLRFKTAYKELVAASKELPDLDVSEGYPFYLLEFEEIEQAVLAWCTTHASRLMQNLPDKVDNPACMKCPFFRQGLGVDGQCKGFTTTWCNIYPYVSFTREMALPVLIATGVNVDGLSDNDIHLLYMRKMDDTYEKRASNDSHRSNDAGHTNSDISNTSTIKDTP